MEWDFVDDFDKAILRLKRRRYDILISDIYRDRDGSQKNVNAGDIRARDLVDIVRAQRFCPIILFSDGQMPDELLHKPFVYQGDKSAPDIDNQLIARIRDAVATGLPTISRKLHDELDGYGGSYVWRFLAERWEDLRKLHAVDVDVLARVIRRRAAIQFGRLDRDGAEGVVERATGDPVDYYVYPPTGTSLRLGEILRLKGTSEFRVVLTPHCFLITQPGDEQPRAGHILTVRTVAAADLQKDWKWQKNEPGIADDLRRRTAFMAGKVGLPDGRYYFLPRFLDIPDLYCDLLQMESLEYGRVLADYDRLAVLDAPYAEALQSGISRLYGSVGVPVLNPATIQHLGPALKVEG